MEQLWLRLSKGLRDYCLGNNFDEVVLGLSGGIDSALVAVLAADALGPQNVHGIMMATKNTSPLSLQIARKITEMTGINYQETNIQPQIDADISFLSELFAEEPKNIVIENLQARERGKILMALSNQFNYLVLACGNKSEAAMGYCTLYGDTCGGLLPIGNLYKTQVYELAKWRNTQSPVLPSEVIARVPTAELALQQKDEDSLPPYAILDKILKMHLDEHRSGAEIVAEGFDAVTVEWILKRYNSQAFKRQQMAPALKF